MEFTLQPLRRLFKKAGAKRVSDTAASELGDVLEHKTKRILTDAKILSEHAGRKTVLRRDIKAARKNIEK